MIVRFTVITFVLLNTASIVRAEGIPAHDKPNFIIIFTDDQGYQDLGCFGSPNIRTPDIDRMAREGMRFTNFYSQTQTNATLGKGENTNGTVLGLNATKPDI